MKLPQPPKPSAPAAELKPVFAWEPFAKIARELPPLLRRHSEEVPYITRSPLDPDWERYFQFDLYGGSGWLTMRSAGFLVGYLCMLIGPHPHFLNETHASVDNWWIDPLYRDVGTLLGMFRRYDEKAKELKARAATLGDLLEEVSDSAYRARLHKVFARLGYVPLEIFYAKDFGAQNANRKPTEHS